MPCQRDRDRETVDRDRDVDRDRKKKKRKRNKNGKKYYETSMHFYKFAFICGHIYKEIDF